MANKKVPEENYRKVEQPKAPNLLSNPDALAEAIDDLDAYESFSNTDNVFNSDKLDRLVVEKHNPYEDNMDKAKKVTKKALKDESMKEFSVEPKKDGPGHLITERELRENYHNYLDGLNEKELMEILKDSDAYAKYLGLIDNLEVGYAKDIKKH